MRDAESYTAIPLYKPYLDYLLESVNGFLSSEKIMSYDVFVCHASEDKKDFVEPMAQLLQQRGLSVWYDDFTLKVGDSLRESIDRGLNDSLYGIVVLSPNFFRKKWTKRELGALIARENDEDKVILPIWHNISEKEVRQYSPILAEKLAVRSDEGIEAVIRKILEVVKPDLIRQKASAVSRLADLGASLQLLETDVETTGWTEPELTNALKITQQATAILTDTLKRVANAKHSDEIAIKLQEAETKISELLMYCVKCQTKIKVSSYQLIKIEGREFLRRGVCPNCGTPMLQFDLSIRHIE